jgi:hypothetical protein
VKALDLCILSAQRLRDKITLTDAYLFALIEGQFLEWIERRKKSKACPVYLLVAEFPPFDRAQPL